MRKLRAILAVFVLAAPWVARADVAEYELVFEGLWDASHASLSFPGGAHFTPLIGDTHTPGAAFWEEGGLASPGVEDVAELGVTGKLSGEIDGRVTAGLSGEEVGTEGIFSFPSERVVVFSIDSAMPEISLISMVAPSPDWFIGVSGLSLRDPSGWISELSIDLEAYDAGTEDGSSFSLSNSATSPPAVISHRGAPFFEGAIIARLHFTLLPEPGTMASGTAALVALACLARGAARHPRA